MSGILTQQLPAPMASDESIVRFLGIFEEIVEPLYRRAGEHHLLVSPSTAPPRALDWLNDILGLNHQGALPEWQRRRIAQVAIEVFPERGSARSLERLLEVYCGHDVTVTEPGATIYGDDETERVSIAIDDPPVRRPQQAIWNDERTVGREAEAGVVAIDIGGLGRMTPARVEALAHEIVPAHLIVRIRVQGIPIEELEHSPPTGGGSS